MHGLSLAAFMLGGSRADRNLRGSRIHLGSSVSFLRPPAVLAFAAALLCLSVPAAAAAAPGSISGTVTDEYGQPAGYVCVSATADTPVPGWPYWADTDDEGNYEITGLAAGRWVVAFHGCAPDYAPEYYDDKLTFQTADRVTVADDTATTGIDASLVEGGKITGLVTDHEGKPLSDMCIDARSGEYPTLGVGGDRTGADGTYRIDSLPTGSYLLSFYDCTGQGQWWDQFYDDATSLEDATYVPVTVGEESAEINAAMHPVTSIVGTVVDEHGSPMADVCVFADPTAPFGGSGDYVRTDAWGRYAFRKLTPTAHRLMFTDCGAHGYATEFYDDAATVGETEPMSSRRERPSSPTRTCRQGRR